MQANRIINIALISILRNKPTCRSIHISRTEIVKSCYGVKLLSAEKEVIFRTANAADKITKRIVYILIRNLTAFVSKRTYRAVSVINIVGFFAVTFLRNKFIATGIVTLLRAVIVHLSKDIGKLAVYVKQILCVLALGTL